MIRIMINCFYFLGKPRNEDTCFTCIFLKFRIIFIFFSRSGIPDTNNKRNVIVAGLIIPHKPLEMLITIKKIPHHMADSPNN